MFAGLTIGLFVFAGIFLATFLLISRLNQKSNDGRRVPPCVPHIPVFGSLPFLMDAVKEQLPRYLMNKSKQLGPVYALYGGSTYMVVLNGRETIHEALITRDSDFAGRTPPSAVHKAAWSIDRGILFCNYTPRYKQIKQIMLTILREFGFGRRLMERRILEEVDAVIEHTKALGGQEFNPGGLMAMTVLNIVLNMMYGHRWQYDDAEFKQLIVDMAHAMENICLEADMIPFLKLFPSYKRRNADAIGRMKAIAAFCRRHIDVCLQNTSELDNFVAQYANREGASMNRDDLSLVLRDVLTAATDTTSAKLHFLLIQLAKHQDLQRRLHAEIDSVVGTHRQPLLEDRPRMVLMVATMLEALRIHNVLPVPVPHDTLRDTSVGGFHIPVDTVVLVNIYSAHHDPDDWPHPEEFDPDRFIDSDGQIFNKERLLAFSLGKRACLGEQMAKQNMFLLVAGLLQRFNILPPVGYQYTDNSEKSKFIRLCPRH